LDMEKKMELNIILLKIVGDQIGEKRAILEF
jgi:hypothetical protein